MPRRPTTILAVLVPLLLLAVALPLTRSALDAPEASPPAEVNLAPLATETPAAHVLEVAVVYRDAALALEVTAPLRSAGYVITDTARTRVTDIPPDAPDTDVLEVQLDHYALVVHPRAPLYDLDPDQLVAIQAQEAGAGLGGPLVITPDASAWLVGPEAPAGRLVEVDTADEVIDLVATDPTAIGLVPVDALDPRVRALTSPGFDPYQHAAGALGRTRWITGPEREAVARALGWPTEPTELPEDPVRLLATGELIPARCVSDRVATVEGGYDVSYDGTRALIESADLALSHWEPAVIDGAPTPCTPTFNLSTRPEAAEAAARAGIDVALAVGNHVGDCWPGCGYQAAVLETVAHLEAAGLTVAGAGADLQAARAPALVERDDITFAFLGYDDIAFQHYGATASAPGSPGAPGTAHADPEGVASDVRAAKALSDHVIVGFSWGVEYTSTPTDRQRTLARAAIEAGASLVVGNHPHWVQATEWIGDGFVAYGLGNFIFDQDWSVETTQGVILEAGFTQDRLLGVRLRPTAIRHQHEVELLDPTHGEGAAILHQIWTATDALDAVPSR